MSTALSNTTADDSNPFYMDEGEEIVLKIRKHWFLVFLDFAFTLFFVVLPFVIIFIFPSLILGTAQQPVMMLLSAWFMLCSIALATTWTNYYLDLWVVTDKRIVIMEQRSLFNRSVTTMRMERIQDTTVEQRGFYASYFNYGDLTVNTAGDHMKVQTFEGIPDPEYVKSIVIEKIDSVTDHKSKLEFTNDEKPSHSE
jgi:uncharacterized membrane protein YdbT with pleckstrin-like domain